ncbi:MAG: fucose isomerase [Candidatus Aminicenantes bacterium]|nr:fucose isomerase [Candidatus Aminicenantes bacterium]
MNNMPEVNLGMVAVSRDCFPVELSRNRRDRVARECKKRKISLSTIETVVENEKDSLKVLEELSEKKINALVIYLGNFGPEGPTTWLAQKFDGPVMFAAAAEESGGNLIQGRGDAFCGMLNVSYNIGLRKLKPHIPENPVGVAEEIAEKIENFLPVARILIALKKLKIFAFGPRPQDFLACNAPIKPLYDLGIEIMENSELDLYDIFQKTKDHSEIAKVVQDMARDLGAGNTYPDLLPKLAQYEVALKTFFADHLGSSHFAVFANKCWPAFESYFGFVPCYVNSRLAAQGIPVACEVDIYGALSEYILMCASELPATLLDINNTVPDDMIKDAGENKKNYKADDLFMGFHCGNTAGSCLLQGEMKYQLIMNRLMEPEGKPDITRGTLEGRIRPGDVTLFRLQSTPDCQLRAYAAEGEILDIDPKSFGSIGVFAIQEMARFYRYVLIEKKFPHHTAVAFQHVGRTLFSAAEMLGLENIDFNRASGQLYSRENPFK